MGEYPEHLGDHRCRGCEAAAPLGHRDGQQAGILERLDLGVRQKAMSVTVGRTGGDILGDRSRNGQDIVDGGDHRLDPTNGIECAAVLWSLP